ncbi:MAG: Hsp20/alpha crystallin family protein [Gemmatimonadetes bacterium]|nr:Hsp20/alpha crystallin family protein [Gemmatimonadota bacterium]
MAIIRYRSSNPDWAVTPWRELTDLHGRLSRLMDEAFGAGGVAAGTSCVPAVAVVENANHLLVACELPGMTADDVDIRLENNVLTISGEKKEERADQDRDRRYHLWERAYGAFQRSFALPRNVDPGISAQFANGVLTIRLPKTAEAMGRRIQISP